MKLWHWAVILSMAAFCLPWAGFNLYLMYRLVKKYGTTQGMAYWRIWRV